MELKERELWNEDLYEAYYIGIYLGCVTKYFWENHHIHVIMRKDFPCKHIYTKCCEFLIKHKCNHKDFPARQLRTLEIHFKNFICSCFFRFDNPIWFNSFSISISHDISAVLRFIVYCKHPSVHKLWCFHFLVQMETRLLKELNTSSLKTPCVLIHVFLLIQEL